jgi:hypothetical protein
MTLPAGSRLGPYEILAPLGAGGMGEVHSCRMETIHAVTGCADSFLANFVVT